MRQTFDGQLWSTQYRSFQTAPALKCCRRQNYRGWMGRKGKGGFDVWVEDQPQARKPTALGRLDVERGLTCALRSEAIK